MADSSLGLQINSTLVSPLFMGGADAGRNIVEWRAASARGLLRYWWRALVGPKYGTQTRDMAKLQAAENRVFGAAGAGSPWVIGGSVPLDGDQYKQRSRDRDAVNGIDYLFWPAHVGVKKTGGRVYAQPGQGLPLTITPRLSTLKGLDDIRTELAAAVWAWLRLGGSGSRSRRCGGSLQPTKVTGWDDQWPALVSKADSADAMAMELVNGIHRWRRLLQLPDSPSSPAYEALTSGHAAVWVVGPEAGWRDWDTACDVLGRCLQEARGEVALTGRAVYGWPIASVPREARRSMPNLREARRGSPLMLRLAALADGRLVGVVVVFTGAYLPHPTFQPDHDWLDGEEPHGRRSFIDVCIDHDLETVEV